MKIFAVHPHRLAAWAQRFLIIGGALALSYVAFTLAEARLYQQRADRSLERQMQTQTTPAAVVPVSELKEGDVLGRLEISRLGVRVAVLQGTSSKTLRLGAGHIAGTALLGEGGNIGIAGHRDTFFRALKDIRKNDEIQIQTANGLSLYEVDWARVVAPNDVAVLAPTTGPALTLVTCYPFYFIGPAPERFVVHAHRQFVN
jgi:sortase A